MSSTDASGRLMLLIAASGFLGGCTSVISGESVAPTGSPVRLPLVVTVNFQLNDSGSALNGCQGSGGYSDIGTGTPVTLRNGAGDLLATASLGSGSNLGVSCVWETVLRDVPRREDFYVVEVGDRGEISQSRTELEAGDFTFDISLG